jgi:hypothetical protein
VRQLLSRRRSLGVWLITVTIVGVALSACSSPTSGVLSSADIPNYLGVKYNPSASASASASAARSVRHVPCNPTTDAVFDGFKKPYPPTITSTAFSCASDSQAQRYFNATKVGAKSDPIPGAKGHSVRGIGDEAWFIDQGRASDLNFYTLVWRQGNRVRLVSVEGPISDKRITPALIELLARRAAARS